MGKRFIIKTTSQKGEVSATLYFNEDRAISEFVKKIKAVENDPNRPDIEYRESLTGSSSEILAFVKSKKPTI
jgi:hypothetical protein